MKLPELLKTTKKGKTFDLVATTNGKRYSVKFKEDEWLHQEGRSRQRYRLPRNYAPHHLKNLKKGCNLFLDAYFVPVFEKAQAKLADGSTLRPLINKNLHNDSENAENHLNRGNKTR